MTEEKEKRVFILPQEELDNPKYRKGYPGRLYSPYPKSWDKDAVNPHKNYSLELSSFYKAGKYVGIRDLGLSALNALLPKKKFKKEEK